MDKPQLVDGTGSVLIDGSTPTGKTRITVAPGDVVKTLVDASNYCGPAPAPPVSVAFVLSGGGRIVATPFSATDATIPPCNGAGSPASIEHASVGPLMRHARQGPDHRARLRRGAWPGRSRGSRRGIGDDCRRPCAGEASRAEARRVAAPTLAQLIGQKLVIRMSGTTPTADLLGRIERGEIGGVIVFAANIVEQHPAEGAHHAAPGGRDGRRPAAAPHRGRPGGWHDPARPVRAADACRRQADGRRRSDIERPGTGDGDRRRRCTDSASTSTSPRSRTCRSTPARSCTSPAGRSRSTRPRPAASRTPSPPASSRRASPRR